MRKEVFKQQEQISLVGVLIELPYFVAVIVVAFTSGSLILMLDAFATAGVIADSGISYAISKKLQHNHAFSFDYGMGKVESFGGFVSAIFILFGLAVVLMFSISELISPSEAGEVFLWAVFLKIFSVVSDIWLYRKQLRAARAIDSHFVDANLISTQSALVFDGVALITVSMVYFLRDVHFMAYIEPLVCIGCVIFYALQSIKNLRKTIPDLLDKTLDENEQLLILKCFSEIALEVKDFEGIRSRRSGHVIYIDLLVTFDDDTTYIKTREVIEKFDRAVRAVLPDSINSIIICAPQDI